MTMLQELTRLNELHDSGLLAEPERQSSARRAVIGDIPGDATAMADELRRLKCEAALAQLDREYETIRQGCLVKYRRVTREPTLDQIWGPVFAGFFITLFLVGQAVRETNAWGKYFQFLVAGGAFLLFWRSVLDICRKWERFTAARTDWQRSRDLLQQCCVCKDPPVAAP